MQAHAMGQVVYKPVNSKARPSVLHYSVKLAYISSPLTMLLLVIACKQLSFQPLRPSIRCKWTHNVMLEAQSEH
jgi:hypothetical protein